MKLITTFLTVFIFASATVRAGTWLDFDGDSKSDFVILRYSAGPNIDWYIYPSATGAWYVNRWGLSGGTMFDHAAPADYDGDNRTDVAVWRPSGTPGESAFYILNSSNGVFRFEPLGSPGDLLNVIGDYDGDGKADPAVYQRSLTSRNRFMYRGSLNNPSGAVTTVYWGMGAEVYPYPGDFDGDGKSDVCVQNANLGRFALKRSSDGQVETIDFGQPTDVLAPSGDYDGDGRTDFCVIRFGRGGYYDWFIKERDGGGTGLFGIRWGHRDSTGLFAVGGDYEGDGRSDIGVYTDPGDFQIRKSSDLLPLIFHWGNGPENYDIPVYVY